MKKLILFELRKAFSKRLALIALIGIILFSALLSFSTFQNKYAFDQNIGEVRHCGGGRLHRQHDALGGQRAAKRKTLDHGKNSLSPKNQKPFCTFILRQALPENKRQNRHVFATKPS